MNENQQLEVNELYALMARDPDVKMLVNTVLAKEDLDIFELAEQMPELFEQVYDSAFEMVAELGDLPNVEGY